MGPGLNEVVSPDVVWPAWPETDARAVVEPQAAPLGLLDWNLQPLASPDAFYPLVVHTPALCPQERCNPAIAIAAVLARETNDRRRQRILVRPANSCIALRRARLPQNAASSALRHTLQALYMFHTAPATRGAYQFPSAASFRISLSRVRSATARFKRPFSASSSFSRRA